MAKILLVDDDAQLVSVVVDWLSSEGHIAESAADGKQAQYVLKMMEYDVIILDWSLPEISGVDVLKEFRAGRGTTPILMLTAKTSLNEKETGLDAGADDYLTKPFELQELSARVRALLRRGEVKPSNTLEVGPLILDPVKHRVTLNAKEIKLAPREFAFLEFLMRHPDRVFSADALLKRVFPSDTDMTPDAVRTYIMRLRKKIDGGHTELIETIERVGYRLKVPPT